MLLLVLASSCSNGSANKAYMQAPGAEGAERLLVLVSNEASGDISLIDSQTEQLLRNVPVGKRPRGLKVSPDGSKLYVALSGSPRGGPNVDESTLPPPDRSADGIGVLAISSMLPHPSARALQSTQLAAQSDQLAAPGAPAAQPSNDGVVQQIAALEPPVALTKLESGDDPETVDATPDGRVLAVANEDAARVRLMDAQSGAQRASIEVGVEPEGVKFRPDGKIVYVLSEASDRVDVIDVAELRTVATLTVGKRPRSVVFDPAGERAYISCELAERVDVIDARAHRLIGSITIEGTPKALPMGLALDPTEDRLYVSLGRAGEVAVLNTRSLRLLTRIGNVGTRPWGIALSPEGDKLYTANGPSGDVSVIDTRSLQVVRRIPAGKLPWGLALVRVPAS